MKKHSKSFLLKISKTKALLIFVLTVFFGFGCAEKQAPTKQPNIIYIMADDLGYGDLSCYGQEKFETPNIDRLAEEGMKFTNFYSGSTVCAPSRSALMTGLHTGHTPIRGNKEFKPEGQMPMPKSTKTIAHLLKEAGYTSGIVGKWGLGYPGSGSEPLDMGFDYFFGENCQRHAHQYFTNSLWENNAKVEYDTPIYSHDAITEKGINFIQENKEKPFFLYIAYAIPHAELRMPEEYLEPFVGKYAEPHPFNAPGSGYGAQTHPRAALAAMISHLDSDVGKITQLLQKLGIEDNTLVIFTSDNGPHKEGGADPEFFNSNGGLRGFKRDLYEGGIRVPFIAKLPGYIKEGEVSNHISAAWDIFPTLSQMAGVEVEDELDGISMVPTLTGKNQQQKEHKYLYWEFHELGGRQAIRKREWKGVKNNVESGDSKLELYNLESDRAESKDLSAEFPKITAELNALLEEARTSSSSFPFPLD